MPLQRKAVILHSSFGISRDYPPSCVRKQGAGNDSTKAGGTDTSSTAIVPERCFYTSINYDKEKNSARQAGDDKNS